MSEVVQQIIEGIDRQIDQSNQLKLDWRYDKKAGYYIAQTHQFELRVYKVGAPQMWVADLYDNREVKNGKHGIYIGQLRKKEGNSPLARVYETVRKVAEEKQAKENAEIVSYFGGM